MPKTDSITQARLKELLSYDPLTGLLVWLVRPSNRVRIGDVAGSPDKRGYIQIRIDGVAYQAHRLIFLYVLGWMPKQVDHDNQVKGDNRWENLNPATSAINMKNKPLQSNNTSGHCGAYWHKRDEKWQAGIRINYKQIWLGTFDTKADAIAARQAADLKYKFHTNHGK